MPFTYALGRALAPFLHIIPMGLLVPLMAAGRPSTGHFPHELAKALQSSTGRQTGVIGKQKVNSSKQGNKKMVITDPCSSRPLLVFAAPPLKTPPVKVREGEEGSICTFTSARV